MAKFRVLFVLLLSLFVTAALHAETYGAVLTPQQEVPPTTSNGFGSATVTLDPAHTSIRVQLFVTGLTTPINNAHIHGEAPAGTNAGVQINFFPATNIVNGRMDTTFTIDKALGDRIAANPHLYYVNVHTTQNPGGEVRGQLVPNDDVLKFAADLRGANEVPPVTTTATGSALVTLDAANNLTWEVNSGSIVSPTLAHIHRAAAGTNGNVVVTFAANSSAFTNGRLRGSAVIDAALANDIRTNPAGFYVNVHTTANGGGEIRGQLATANEYDIPVAGKVTGAADTNFVTDVRVFNPSFSTRASALVEFFQSGLAPNTNATGSVKLDIPPRGTAVLDDATGANFINVPGVTGALRVTSTMPVAVTSRIYNDLRGTNRGTFGQFISAATRATAWRRGILPQLSNRALTSSPSGFRTNVGLFNPNTSTASLRLELRDAGGALLGTQTLDVAALSQFQTSIATVFPTLDLSDRANLTLTFDSSVPVVAYASVVDNVSSDQIFVMAIQDTVTP
jgi:hypothetical protein